MARWVAVLVLLVVLLPSACQRRKPLSELALVETLAELRTIKGAVLVTFPGEKQRTPYPRERLIEGTEVTVPFGGLGWMRRDGGATWLISGPAKLTVSADHVELSRGRAFVDSELAEPVSVRTPRGKLELSEARVSLEVASDGAVSAYVLRGSARTGDNQRAAQGELLTLNKNGQATRKPVVAWEDWTGGLATADAAADPAPFGIGTVGARKPGDTGKPRFPLVIQRLEVNVTIDHDFAVTEVDQTFVNPSSETVEGIFSFRTPTGAVLQRFGIDRDGELAWGRIKERAEAAQQYQSNVYQGSDEDPALLEWAAQGVYKARLYPIHPGAKRRVVTRYSEWLPRQGKQGQRRLYVYPMAAEGAKGSLPRIEELTVRLDLSRAGAKSVRSGMGGKRQGKQVIVKAFDFVPRADLAIELFDSGKSYLTAYRAPHGLSREDAPANADPSFAQEVSAEESDYIAIPLRAPPLAEPTKGVDLAIVVDTSAATEPSALAIARTMAASLLTHLGPDDRAALWAGDAALKPVAKGSGALSVVDEARRKAWLAGLASVERGGATDLGALLTRAASALDPKRRGAVVYIGDGAPSVGELAPKGLRERLSRLPSSTRLLFAAVGSRPNLALLESLSRGAPVEQVYDAYAAARASLRLLEAAGRNVWLSAKLELGPFVERVLPRELPPISVDQTIVVVGRIIGTTPTEITLRAGGQTSKKRLHTLRLKDAGDLRRRWGQARLMELMAEGAGRASLVDIGQRFGVVSPFTSLYVPTKREVAQEQEDPLLAHKEKHARRLRWKPWSSSSGGLAAWFLGADEPKPLVMATAELESQAQRREGGTGTRAKGEAEAMDGLAEAEPRFANAPAPSPDPALRERSRGAQGASGFSPNLSVGQGFGGGRRAKKSRLPTKAPVAARHARRPKAAADPLVAESVAAEAVPAEPAPAEAARSGPLDARLEVAVAHEAEASGQHAAHVSRLATIGHEPSRCGSAADLPLRERAVLWRERLSRVNSANEVLGVYRGALRTCEATDWRERSTLLIQMVDRLSSVRERVSLWRALLSLSPAAAEAVYRFLLSRVETSQDLRDLHDALGLKRVDPDLLKVLLNKAGSKQERLAALRGAAERFPDDTELALLVLDAYEDAGDDAGGRAWARKLRRRVDATAHVRTTVGEYYMRLAKRGQGASAKRDVEEARRTFGEIVEFAPEDPRARRRLGDLLRAHSFYDEALRQYQTLAVLTPDDPSVPLLIAAAVEGTGKTEEAVRWTEKAAATGAPNSTSPVSLAARAYASAFLASARLESARKGKAEEVRRLLARAARLSASESTQGIRVILTWSHPELRVALWTNGLGSMMPAPDNLPLLGVAQAFLPPSPAPVLELRLDPEDAARAARLDLEAVLTVIAGEGTKDEKIVRSVLHFRDEQGKPKHRIALRFEAGALKAEEQ